MKLNGVNPLLKSREEAVRRCMEEGMSRQEAEFFLDEAEDRLMRKEP